MSWAEQVDLAYPLEEYWCDSSEASGDEQERERKEMSWAEQVDLAYPLEEYWCNSCLRHPHDYTDGHQIPEKKSAKREKEERNMTRKMEIWTSEASDDEKERERKEMSWSEQVDLAYPLEEYWCEARGLEQERERKEMSWSEQVDLAYPLEEYWCDSSEASGDEQERERKEMSWAEQVDLAYPLEEYWCEARGLEQERERKEMSWSEQVDLAYPLEEYWCDSSEASGDEQERERKEMSWAEQVDLAYPLEEYWCNSCLRHPHDYTDGHQIPEKKSAKGEKEERNMTRKMEIWTSEASGDEKERERKEMSWSEQVDLAYPLEEYWCDSCLRHPNDYTDGHHIPEKKSAKGEMEERNMTRKMEIWTSEASDDEKERKRKEMSWSEQVDLAYPLEEYWCDSSEASDDEQERERKEMSRAEQVDLAYPLEECEFRMQI
ncbi:cilia- and flagella-associated protein 251-like isoform X4 [Clupea harengus]|uniref:Cilia- and flagella-associated protein 251-like isoform X4 n=1 Tax=Clupea harengus TaxID=7950 RepID=A0A8M1KDG7_CLUHA|nr:cilia- and flagella-associated protein 251-like isoform X4 [Clupea harengus]